MVSLGVIYSLLAKMYNLISIYIFKKTVIIFTTSEFDYMDVNLVYLNIEYM